MTHSAKFNLTRYIILEYLYTSDELLYTSQEVGYRKIINEHNKEITIVNRNQDILKTGNTTDGTVVELPNGKYVNLDIDQGYFYPNVDDKIQISEIIPQTLAFARYDKVRIHLISGYNFDDIKGLIMNIKIKRKDGKDINLLNQKVDASNYEKIIFNPRPIKIAEFIYDKYIEWEIISISDLLAVQSLNPSASYSLPNLLTDSIGVLPQPIIYGKFSAISNIVRNVSTGFDEIETSESKNIIFSAVDNFKLLVPKVRMATDGDYFEFFAEYDGQTVENFIYNLNSSGGNAYYLIHDIRLVEQVGDSFYTTDEFSQIQLDKFDKILKYRPILEYGDRLVSYSVEYTLRLYNKNDGRSIFKTSSYTFKDASKFSKSPVALNIYGVDRPIKVYNKVENTQAQIIKDNLNTVVKTKYVSVFYDKTAITVGNGSVSSKEIEILPFDGIYRFDLITNKDGMAIMKLDPYSKYNMVFRDLDGKEYRVGEFVSKSFDKSEGTIAFRISKLDTNTILKFKSYKYFVVSISPDGTEQAVFVGTWKSGL